MLWSRQYGQPCAVVCLLRRPPETSTLPLSLVLRFWGPSSGDHSVRSLCCFPPLLLSLWFNVFFFFLSGDYSLILVEHILSQLTEGLWRSGLSSPGLWILRLFSYTWHFGWVWHSEWSLIPAAWWRCPLTVPSSGAAVGSGATLMPKLLYVTLSPLRKLSGPSLSADCYEIAYVSHRVEPMPEISPHPSSCILTFL